MSITVFTVLTVRQTIFSLRCFLTIVIRMKVMLIQPPIEDFYDTSIRTYPLGLLYAGTRIGTIADVVLFDARTGIKPQSLPGHEFAELKPYYQEDIYTPFSFFSKYSRFGMPAVEIKKMIAHERPHIVGIASMCSAYERQTLEVAEAAKQVDSEIVTVLGGIHATLFPEHLLSNPCVDYCIRGEGETPFFELVSALSSGASGKLTSIPGLCFKEAESFHVVKASFEREIGLVPDRRLIDPDRYRINKKRYTFFLTSRGCPFSCGFCGKPESPYRKRSLASIEKEIHDCANLGIEAIDFEDDMLNLDKKTFASVLRLIAGKGFALSAMNGIYPGNVDGPTLELMHAAGFRRLNFSLVDTSESVLLRQKRRLQPSFVQLLPYLEASPFLVEVHFIIGLPGQRPKELIDTLLFLMGKRLLIGPSIFYLSPGSPLHRSIGRTPIPFQSMRSSFMLPFNPYFPRTVTFTFVKLVRFINYVKQVLDRQTGITRMSDLLDHKVTGKDGRKEIIIRRLLIEKRFACYDLHRHDFRDEAVDASLVRAFFQKAEGARIKGFKTGNSLLVDVRE